MGSKIRGPQDSAPLAVDLDSEAFRLFLQSELVRRCKANPRYSLRSFARSMAVEPSAMSKLLAGKRRVTAAMFEQLSQRLGLEPQQVESFRSAQGGGQPRAGATSARGVADGEGFVPIDHDAFAIIADWYHMAIFEMMRVEGFRSDPAWIARALGISVHEANAAIERMLRLGLLARRSDGSLVGGRGFTTTGMPFTTVALRKVQRQVLEMAIHALDETPLERRDQSTMTMAVNPEQLAAAKLKIKEFRRRLCKFLESKPPCTDVYHLSISLYPVTRIREAKR
jgi:uncharacterized protein (TIGR02147 family)